MPVQAGIMPVLVLRRVVHALLKRLLRLALQVVSASQQANQARSPAANPVISPRVSQRDNHLSPVASLRGSLLVNPAVSPPLHRRLLGNVQWVATLRLVSAHWFPLVPIFEYVAIVRVVIHVNVCCCCVGYYSSTDSATSYKPCSSSWLPGAANCVNYAGFPGTMNKVTVK